MLKGEFSEDLKSSEKANYKLEAYCRQYGKLETKRFDEVENK